MPRVKPEVQKLMDHIQVMINEGFEKKHFEFRVVFAPHTYGKTRVRVTSGESVQFVLRKGELEE